MRRAAIDPVPGGEIFEFRDSDGNLIPPDVLFTTYGDILLEHVIKTITFRQLGNILAYNRHAAQWIKDKRVWMHLFKRDYPHTFYLVHEPGTTSQMKEYYRNMLDIHSKNPENVHTYYKRYYELHIRLLLSTRNPPVFKFIRSFQELTSNITDSNARVRGFYGRIPSKHTQGSIGVIVVQIRINDKTYWRIVEIFLSPWGFISKISPELVSSFKFDEFLNIPLKRPNIVPGTTMCFAVDETRIIVFQPKLETQLVSCNICDSTTNLQQCSQCGEANYCSVECQEQDWEEHSKTCQ